MTSPMQLTFRELFCQQRGCNAGDFEREMLEASVYPEGKRWLRLLSFIDVTSIRLGRELIREVGRATSLDHVEDAVKEHQTRMFREASSFAYRFNLRISCRRLLDICCAIATDDQAGQMELFGPARNIIRLPAQRPMAVDF